eukprot:2786826-Rhodomonas_salina.1
MDDGLAMVYQCCPLALRFAHLPEVHSGEVKENRGLQRREEGGRERGWDSAPDSTPSEPWTSIPQMRDLRTLTLDHDPRLDPTWTLHSGPWTLDPRSSALDVVPRHQTLNRIRTLDPSRPQTRDLSPETRIPRPSSLDARQKPS